MASGLYGITPNLAGIDAVLSSASVKALLLGHAESIASSANANAVERGASYRALVDQASYVALGKVVCGNAAARRDNARHNTLLKSR